MTDEWRGWQAYRLWCLQYAAAWNRIGWIYFADCKRGK